MMQTYQASVRAHVKGRSQVIKTEVRALNAQEARWLLRAQFGFHSIQASPSQIKLASLPNSGVHVHLAKKVVPQIGYGGLP